MASYGNSLKQELLSGQENRDGRTHRHRTVIVVTIVKHALMYFTNINMEEKRTFEYQKKMY